MKLPIIVFVAFMIFGAAVSGPVRGSGEAGNQDIVRAIEAQTKVLEDIERVERDQLDVLKQIRRSL